MAAQLYRAVRRPRGRKLDLAIAACAIAGMPICERSMWATSATSQVLGCFYLSWANLAASALTG